MNGMRGSVLYLGLSVLLLIGMSDRVQAIAVTDLSISEDPPTDEGYTFNWNYVVNYKGASACAVDHYWILTAAHVADDSGSGSLTIGGETYTQQEIVYHSKGSDPDSNETADMALVRYDKPLPGYYLLNNAVPVGNEIIICGFGHSGNVVSTISSAYFTSNGGAHTTRRWGTNKIDNEGTRSYSGPAPLGLTENKGFDVTISTTKGNAGKTAYEAGCNIYDSGGSMFYNDGGVWKLTGHMTLRFGTATSGQFAGNFAVATKYYVNWIKSVIVDYDTDMDGLPDWWEDMHGASETAMDANGYSDSDSFTNYEEWLADTDPNDGNSFLALNEYTHTVQVAFSSSTNRDYQVQYQTNLTNEPWMTEIDWFSVAGTQTVKTVSTGTSNRFYRIRAKLQ